MDINQIIEKFKNDPAFAAKYSALTGVDAILEQAKADGYDVTKEDIVEAIQQLNKQSGELSESDLAVVSGGKATTDNWDPVECAKITKMVVGRCETGVVDCDHFRREQVSLTKARFTCVMGRYRYEEGK